MLTRPACLTLYLEISSAHGRHVRTTQHIYHGLPLGEAGGCLSSLNVQCGGGARRPCETFHLYNKCEAKSALDHRVLVEEGLRQSQQGTGSSVGDVLISADAGVTWTRRKPARGLVCVIRPGAGTFQNREAYAALVAAGFNVRYLGEPDLDDGYPTGW